MRARAALLVLVTAAMAVIWAGMPGFSTAAYTASTTNTGSRVTAAADWTPPAVVLTAPGASVKDTVTLTAAATDGETGVKNAAIQYLAADGSTWVTICTAAGAPYACAWNTRTLADGSYELRATATDNAGYSATSPTVRTIVANNLLVVLGDVADAVRGSTGLSAAVYNAGLLVPVVRFEYSPADTNNWKSICTNLSAPYSCSWNTAALANDFYDVRAVAVAGGTTYYSVIADDVLADNQAPAVTMTDPGTPLSGTRTFQAAASDAHSGIAKTVIQSAPAGSGTYRDLCTINTEPYSCRFDTKSLTDGNYTFRAVATDLAGNSTVSAPTASRVVDNTVSAVSMDNPGIYLTGTVTLSAAASSNAGVRSVTIQRAPGGTTTWTDVCTDTTAPYSCSWNSATVANGLYDFRAVLVDGAGQTTISAPTAGHQVDNTPLRGYDVQAVNAVTVGKLQPGDSLTFTYNQRVNLTSLAAGWTGSAQAITVRLRDGALLGLGTTGDTLDVQYAGGAVNLGSVNLKQNFVKASKTVTFNATMTAGTTTANGLQASTVTITLGTVASNSSSLRTASTAASMVWTPSSAARDLNGVAASTAPVTEGGTLDRDF
ncbi:Ig-like domain-containing protein [Arthrobacter mangrovi]|uniref:Signal peptidase I n=1 Tax=Arthrobacter mangrovi TaxID=2966350 RepID=A0ABQ5MYH0_9MICC|nr:Ig-like domain-containing protein [Arthrobacter mangrovi]GLB68732.1 hypothetical protein AHIS1636_31740 [Arthrobacter mangrovi]